MMRKYVGTALAAAVVIALAVLSILWSDAGLTPVQQDTLRILLIVCAAAMAYCFIVGELANNYSQMDKLWSLLPIAYTWIIAAKGGMNPRLVIYALIVTAWGIRLTVNFARKGAYSWKFWTGEEDYRWAIVRGNPIFKRRIAWAAFDLFFISIYQNALVLAICLPALAAMSSTAALGWIDAAAAAAALLFLALELISDEIQWKFYQNKKKMLSQGRALESLDAPYDLGFNTMGPWGVMRHPNYLGEQGIWLSLYFFAVAAGVANMGIFHWSLVGPLVLVLLFSGSSALGEGISSKKYPLYADYTRQVFKYLPLRRFDRSKAE